MALKVWLPLNGDIENKGLSDYKFINTNAVVDNNGKIGKCYSFVRSDSSRIYLTDFNLSEIYTVAFWFNPADITSTTQWLVCVNKAQGTATQIPMGVYLTTSGLFIDCGGQKNYQPTLTAENWYHLAISFDENHVVRTYLNGTLLGSWEGTVPEGDTPHLTLGARANNDSGTAHTYFFNGKINDFRLYDEALSAKEIKEISKGLIAHYKFDGPKALPNILKDTNQGTYGFLWNVGARYNKTMEEVKWKGVKACRFGITDGDTSSSSNWRVIQFRTENFVTNNILKPSTNYIISFDTDIIGKIAGCYIKAGNSTHTLCDNGTIQYKTLKDGTYHYSILITTYTSDHANWSYNDQFLYINYNLTEGEFGTIANLKMEEGIINTPWIPKETEDLYTDLGYDKSFAMDCSGYGYNGTQSGDLVYSVDSPRYNGSTIFSGSELLNSPVGSVIANSRDFTISGWFYRTGNGTVYYSSTSSGAVPVCLEKQRYFIYDAEGTSKVGNWNSTANEWQHIVLVHNSVTSTLTLYVNGTQTGQIATTGTIYNRDVLNIGGRNSAGQFGGKISDFRIYTTALSANDILTMYKNSAIIDNKGNAFAYEFVEEGVM